MDAMLPTGRARLLFGNALYAARPEGAPFAEVSDSLGVETWWPWGPSADDLNADGWDDLFITAGMNFPYPYAPNDLLLNDQGRRFVPSAFRLGVEPRRGGKTVQPWFTVHCGPGGVDAASKSCEVCRSPQAAQAGCRMAADGTATMDAARASRSSVIADLDGDGDLDIVTNEFNAAPQLLVSALAARARVQWLAVRLRGTVSNRQGLGARVTVTLPGGRRLVKWNDGQSGYLSHSDLPLYFGLGDATAVASLEVRWPSGRTQVVPAPVATRRVLEIVER